MLYNQNPLIKKRDPGRSLGTVYRILNVIMAQGLIQKLPFGAAMLNFEFFQHSIVILFAFVGVGIGIGIGIDYLCRGRMLQLGTSVKFEA